MTNRTFTTPTDEKTARQFFAQLGEAGLMFHPDDPACECLEHHCLTDDEIATIQNNMNLTFEFLDDPYEVALEVLNARKSVE